MTRKTRLTPVQKILMGKGIMSKPTPKGGKTGGRGFNRRPREPRRNQRDLHAMHSED